MTNHTALRKISTTNGDGWDDAAAEEAGRLTTSTMNFRFNRRFP
jgi:hypothetical protein